MNRILYFEGAGCVPCNDVENCRIRTAFTNRNGEKIYIEIQSGSVYSKRNKSKYEYISCAYCFRITDDENVDDCNKSRLSCEGAHKELEYTKKNILDFVNKYCDANFEEIVILDDLAGYRVHADTGKYNTSERYNFIDTFVYDAELTRRRRAKVEEMEKEFCALFKQKHDNTSYYIENNQLVVLLNVSEQKRIAAGYTERKFIVEV